MYLAFDTHFLDLDAIVSLENDGVDLLVHLRGDAGPALSLPFDSEPARAVLLLHNHRYRLGPRGPRPVVVPAGLATAAAAGPVSLPSLFSRSLAEGHSG